MRLLIRPRPDIDVAVMEEAPFVADRTILRDPGLDDQVERFPVSLVHPNRIAIGRRDLPWDASHEADLYAAARHNVGERHFLGDADRLPPISDRIS